MKFTDPTEAVQHALKVKAHGAGSQADHADSQADHADSIGKARLEAARAAGYDAGFFAGYAAAMQTKDDKRGSDAEAATGQLIADLINQQRAA